MSGLADGGELRAGCLRNRCGMGQIMAFCPGNSPAGHARGSGVGTNARKRANGRNRGILVRTRESKMEIPEQLFLKE